MEEFAMTSLGKLIFIDSHSRHSKSLSSDESSNLDYSESLSLAFESLFHMPYDIIENYANSINTLDISHNKFSRYFDYFISIPQTRIIFTKVIFHCKHYSNSKGFLFASQV